MNALLPIAAPTQTLTVGDSSSAGGCGAGLTNRPFGPPTTNDPCGLGGPLNHVDREIAHWRALGKPHLADGLQAARAKFAVAFKVQEPVFVPTDAQRRFYAFTSRLRGDAA